MGMTPIGPGTLLAGRFRLEDLLEEAGGARFWRATDLTLVRDVAVHVIDDSDPRAPAMLAAARRSATVSGPHILRVLDAAVEDGVAYVVNEWGNGVSLDRMLLEGPLQARQAAWLVREAADAIADSHRVGVAHGRLIPENVMVTDTGSVKLIGFVVDAALRGTNGGGLGDQKTDVTNLAALLYAALTARWPGVPESNIAAAPRDHGRVLRPRQVRAGVPRPLDRICDSVLNHTDATFPIETAHEIKAALADFLGEFGEGMPPSAQQSNGEPTQAIRLPSIDPEATQAGMPVFVDDDTTDGWMPLAAEATQVQPVPPVRPAAQPTSSKSPYVGMGGGSAPVTWGPDAQPGPETSEPGQPGSPIPWLRLAGLASAVLALLVAVIFAFNLGRGGGSEPESGGETPSTESPSATVLQVAAVDDFDPFGGPDGENPDSVGNTTDGRPGTTWRTSTYRDGPDLTVYKPGVGVLVDLGEERPVSEVSLNLVGEPSTVRLLAAPAGAAAPTTINGLDEVAVAQKAGKNAALTPDSPVNTRYLVVWFTGLPQVSGGYRGEVAEIVVRS